MLNVQLLPGWREVPGNILDCQLLPDRVNFRPGQQPRHLDSQR